VAAAARVTDCSHMVDVHAEAEIWKLHHLSLSRPSHSGIGWPRLLGLPFLAITPMCPASRSLRPGAQRTALKHFRASAGPSGPSSRVSAFELTARASRGSKGLAPIGRGKRLPDASQEVRRASNSREKGP
jgi:hypothetical protein